MAPVGAASPCPRGRAPRQGMRSSRTKRCASHKTSDGPWALWPQRSVPRWAGPVPLRPFGASSQRVDQRADLSKRVAAAGLAFGLQQAPEISCDLDGGR